jgi:hypothetical protein
MENPLIANGAEQIRIDGEGRLSQILPESEAHSVKCSYLSRIVSPRAVSVTEYYTRSTEIGLAGLRFIIRHRLHN